jgi:hypothetical protein
MPKAKARIEAGTRTPKAVPEQRKPVAEKVRKPATSG